MAYAVEFIARLKDEVTGKLKGMAGAAKDLQANLKAGFVDGVRSALPDQLGFIADQLDALPIGALAAGGAFLAVGSAAVKMATDVADSAIAFDKLSQKTGASVEFLSTFSAVANDAELSTEEVAQSLTMFSRRLIETQGAGANVEATLFALADAFKGMADGPQKTALAMEYFGRSGAQMIPILNQGSAALRENMTAMQDMGRVITGETVAAANAFDDAMDALNGRLDGLKTRIGSAVLPAINELVGGLDGGITGVDLLGKAFEELTQKGQVSAMTMLQLQRASLDVGIANTYLNPSMMALRISYEQQRAAIDQQIQSMRASSGASKELAGAMISIVPAANAAGSAVLSASDMIAVGAARMQAAAGYYAKVGQVFKTTQERIVAQQDIVASNFAAAQRQQIAAQQKSIERAKAAAIADRDSNLARMESNTELTASIDDMNLSLDKQMGLFVGGGGAARVAADGVNQLTEAQKSLKQAQQDVGSQLGASLSEMDELQRVQTAYALATGQLSAEQFAQQQAVKAVMQATKDKAISEDQAVATALALAAGVASTKDAYDIAGPSGARFAEEQAKVQAAADKAGVKVKDMVTAIKNLPANTTVDVVATVNGMDKLAAVKRELLDLHERHSTVYVDVVYRTNGAPAGVNGTGNAGNGRGSGGPPGGHESDGSGASGIDNARAGNAYKIGEDGPEWFVPSQDGAVIPNYKTKSTSTPAVINLVVDGRTLARVVAPHLK